MLKYNPSVIEINMHCPKVKVFTKNMMVIIRSVAIEITEKIRK